MPASSVAPAAVTDSGDGGDDGVKPTSVNTTLKPASTGDAEFLSYKITTLQNLRN